VYASRFIFNAILQQNIDFILIFVECPLKAEGIQEKIKAVLENKIFMTNKSFIF